MSVADAQERIVQRPEIPRQYQCCNSRLIGLESNRDNIAHQPRVFPEILGQTVRRAIHGEERAILQLGLIVRRILGLPHRFDALLHFTQHW